MKLPDSTVLGGAPNLESGRRIANYDATAIARGAAAVGEGIAALGKGMQKAGADVEAYKVENDRADYAKAKSDFETNLVDLNSRYAHDQDYSTVQDRYGKDLQSLRDKSAGLIGDASMRERFISDTNPAAARATAGIKEHAFRIEGDTNVAYTQQQGDRTIDLANNTNDPATRASLIGAQNDLIESQLRRGFITPAQAQKMRQDFAYQYDYVRAQKDPEGVINDLRPAPGSPEQVVGRILNNEGYDKNPRSSAVGAGQFIDSTWLEMIKKHRPDLAQGRSDADILDLRRDKELGREMTQRYMEDNGRALKRAGLDDNPGNLYLAHFLGPAGAIGVLKADPGTPVFDALAKAVGDQAAGRMIDANPSILKGQQASSVVAWAAGKMGGVGPGSRGVYDNLDPLRRTTLLQHAETYAAKQRQQDEAATALEKHEVKSAITDDVASMAATGSGIDNINPQRVKAAYGEDGYAKWQEARQDAHAIWMGSHDLSTMRDEDIAGRLSALEPKAGQPGFDRQRKIYEAVDAKAEEIRKQRDTDPAGSIDGDPAVAAARSKYDPTKPDTFQPIAAARLAAQERIGIPEDSRTPITKGEAIKLTEPLRRMLPGQERETITDLAKQFQAMFGDDADTAFAYALRVHKVDAATAQTAARVVRKLGLGQAVTPEEARAADQDSEVREAEKAVTNSGGFFGGVSGNLGSEPGETYYLNPLATKPGAPVPTTADIISLRNNPKLTTAFNKRYGDGAAEKILKEYPIGVPR